MTVQAVQNVTARSDVLAGAFFLGTLVLVARWTRTGRWPWLIAAVVPAVLAMGSKESALLLPFAAGAVVMVLGGTLRRSLLAFSATSISVMAALLVRLSVLGLVPHANPLASLPMSLKLASSSRRSAATHSHSWQAVRSSGSRRFPTGSRPRRPVRRRPSPAPRRSPRLDPPPFSLRAGRRDPRGIARPGTGDLAHPDPHVEGGDSGRRAMALPAGGRCRAPRGRRPSPAAVAIRRRRGSVPGGGLGPGHHADDAGLRIRGGVPELGGRLRAVVASAEPARSAPVAPHAGPPVPRRVPERRGASRAARRRPDRPVASGAPLAARRRPARSRPAEGGRRRPRAVALTRVPIRSRRRRAANRDGQRLAGTPPGRRDVAVPGTRSRGGRRRGGSARRSRPRGRRHRRTHAGAPPDARASPDRDEPAAPAIDAQPD